MGKTRIFSFSLLCLSGWSQIIHFIPKILINVIKSNWLRDLDANRRKNSHRRLKKTKGSYLAVKLGKVTRVSH